MNANKLRAKDLITTAIFTVVFTLIVFAGSMTVGAVIGMLLGKTMLKKHFEKAGVV
jgi:hypothetical protein